MGTCDYYCPEEEYVGIVGLLGNSAYSQTIRII